LEHLFDNFYEKTIIALQKDINRSNEEYFLIETLSMMAGWIAGFYENIYKNTPDSDFIKHGIGILEHILTYHSITK
jgi:hypothetical protein